MLQIVAANDFPLGVRQKGEGVSSLATERRGFIRSVHADRYWSYSLALELTQTVLNTPQLGVAERSPIAPVENQKQASRFLPVRAWHRPREQRGHRHQVSAGIGKGKVGGLLANCGRARRCRQLARSIHRCVAEEDGGSKTQRRKDRANDLPAEARWARERPADSGPQQPSGRGEHEPGRPRHVASDGKLCEEQEVNRNGRECQQEPDPDPPVEASLHGPGRFVLPITVVQISF